MMKSFYAGIFFVSLLAISVSAGAVQYQIVDLGLGQANDINDYGLIVGTNGTEVMTWDSNGPHNLGIQGQAYAVNNSGVIVGSGNVAPNMQGFIWYGEDDVRATLGRVNDINNKGQTAESPTDWYAYPSWNGINDDGIRVGSDERLYGSSEAGYVSWAISSTGDLQDGLSSWASKISDSGLIIGGQAGYNASSRWWDSTGRYGFFDSFSAQNLNDAYVVGAREILLEYRNGCPWYSITACYWDGTNYVNLGTLPGGDTSTAFGINNNGWIVGASTDAFGAMHAVLWEPVPEPSSILVLLCGMCGLGSIRLRRKSSQ